MSSQPNTPDNAVDKETPAAGLAILDWDWRDILLQAAHRSASLGCIVLAAAVAMRNPPAGMPVDPFRAPLTAVALLAGWVGILASLGAWLIERSNPGEAVGAFVLSMLLFLTGFVFTIASHLHVGQYLQDWVLLRFCAPVFTGVARLAIVVLVIWIALDWSLRKRLAASAPPPQSP